MLCWRDAKGLAHCQTPETGISPCATRSFATWFAQAGCSSAGQGGQLPAQKPAYVPELAIHPSGTGLPPGWARKAAIRYSEVRQRKGVLQRRQFPFFPFWHRCDNLAHERRHRSSSPVRGSAFVGDHATESRKEFRNPHMPIGKHAQCVPELPKLPEVDDLLHRCFGAPSQSGVPPKFLSPRRPIPILPILARLRQFVTPSARATDSGKTTRPGFGTSHESGVDHEGKEFRKSKTPTLECLPSSCRAAHESWSETSERVPARFNSPVPPWLGWRAGSATPSTLVARQA